MRIMVQRPGGFSEHANREALNWEGLWICEVGKVAGAVETALRAEARRVEKSVTKQRRGLTRFSDKSDHNSVHIVQDFLLEGI